MYLAGFGPSKIAVAGEVADGWIIHPLNSPSYVQAVGLSALDKGFARGGRKRSNFAICCQTIVMIGNTDEEIARAREKAKGQIAFYGSTPPTASCSNTTAGAICTRSSTGCRSRASGPT